MQRKVEPLIGPETTYRHNPALHLAPAAQVLASHMRRLRAPLPVSGLIYYQHARPVWPGGWIRKKHLEPLGANLLHIPTGLGEKVLEALHRCPLRTNDRLCTGKRGKRLIALAREEQPLEVAPEAVTLPVGGEITYRMRSNTPQADPVPVDRGGCGSRSPPVKGTAVGLNSRASFNNGQITPIR